MPAPSPPPHPKPHAGAKNLLYIVVDDLRNELGFTNSRKGLLTPHIDALAAKGLVFDRAYVQQGVCSPSRNSFLSGRRPDTTKTWNFIGSFRDALGDSASSWPGAFMQHGWTTVGMGKVYHPGHPPHDDGALSWSLDKFPYFHPSDFAKKISDQPDSDFQDGKTTDVALERLDALAGNHTPFFLAVGLHKPHIPWVMPQRFLDAQVAQADIDTAIHDVPPQGYCNVSLYICNNVYNGLPWVPANKSAQQQHRREYRAAVSWTDFNVNRILTKLDEVGLTNSTMVVFHGDHGWHLGEHGGWCKQSNFDLVARVPLVVYVPWLPQSHGKRTSALVEMVDLMPTTLDLLLPNASATVPDYAQLEGYSFRRLLEHPDTPPTQWKNATFTQYPRCKTDNGEPWEYPSSNPCTKVQSSNFSAMGFSIRSNNWRYTLWVKWQGHTLSPDWDSVVGEELYNHTGDTGFGTDAFDNVNLVTDSSLNPTRLRLRTALRSGWGHALPPVQTE